VVSKILSWTHRVFFITDALTGFIEIILTDDDVSISSWESDDEGYAGTDEAQRTLLKNKKIKHIGEYKNKRSMSDI
jgi:hypothetical protein